MTDIKGYIELYAEVLLNIKSVTLYGSIRTDSNSEAEVLVETDGSTISMSQGGREAAIRLPARTIGKASATIVLPAGSRKEVTSRFEVQGDDVAKLLTVENEIGNTVPWSASTLADALSLSCRHCGQVAVEDLRSLSWKDMPSEHWAEMMDFWHCHKPFDATDTSHEQHTRSKGYSASNGIGASAGEGRAGLLSIFMHRVDCSFFKIDANERDDALHPRAILCDRCETPLGFTDDAREDVRLSKSSLSITFASSDAGTASHVQLPLEQCIAAQLLAAAEASAVRRVVLRNEANPKHGCMLLWMFTPDIWFCSSSQKEMSPRRAIKMLFKRIPEEDADKLSDSMACERVILGPALFAQCVASLERNHELLPQSSKIYQDWSVSLLLRFDRDDLARLNNEPRPAGGTEAAALPIR